MNDTDPRRTAVLAVLGDQRPRTVSELILDVYNPGDGRIDPERLDLIDAQVIAVLPGLVNGRRVVEVLLDQPGERAGQVWYSLPVNSTDRPSPDGATSW